MLVIVKLLLCARTPHLRLAASLGRVVRRQVVWGLRGNLLVNAPPNCVHYVLIVEALKDSVAANHEEIVVAFQFETLDFGIANYNVLISTVFLPLGLDVSECS